MDSLMSNTYGVIAIGFAVITAVFVAASAGWL